MDSRSHAPFPSVSLFLSPLGNYLAQLQYHCNSATRGLVQILRAEPDSTSPVCMHVSVSACACVCVHVHVCLRVHVYVCVFPSLLRLFLFIVQ